MLFFFSNFHPYMFSKYAFYVQIRIYYTGLQDIPPSLGGPSTLEYTTQDFRTYLLVSVVPRH